MPIEFKQTTLPNGMDIIAEVDPTAHTSAIGFFVKTGARDEAAASMGVSHFLEHMMFKGTETRAAEDVDRDFDALGAEHNAFTTSEMTAFYAHTLPEHLGEAETILSDIMRPSIRPEDFNDEKKVILEEIAMYQDHPFWVLYERCMEEYYGPHTLSHRVLGTSDTVSAMERDTMKAYFDHWYAADNTVVALAGDVDFDDVVQRLADHCGHWPTTGAKRTYDTPPVIQNDFTMTSEMVNRHYILGLTSAPSVDDDRRYPAGILSQILGDVEGSRLYWALVETGLAEEAQSQYDGRDGCGDMLVYACCDPADGEQVEATIGTTIDGLIDSVTEDDLVRVRSKVATAATLHGELPGGRMRRLGRLWTYTGGYMPLEDELVKINAVTLDDLRAVYEQFPMRPRVVGRLTPAE